MKTGQITKQIKSLIACALVPMFVTLGALAHNLGSPCAAQLGANYFQVADSGHVLFGPFRSRAVVYSKDITLYNMGLVEAQILAMRGRVLLVGEGFGELLPLFVQAPNVHVTAVDPIYGITPPNSPYGQSLRRFVMRYRPHLHVGTSTTLPALDQSVDRIYSHFLINNILSYRNMAIDTLREAVRVLRKGGEAIYVGTMSEETGQRLLTLLEQSYGSDRPAFKAHVESFLNWKEGIEPVNVVRLVIKKP